MPLVKIEQITEDTKIMIWHMKENTSFYQTQLLDLYESPAPWHTMTNKRKQEFLATRYLIQLGLPPGKRVSDIIKDRYGAPKMVDPDYYFGISHTKNYAACIISNYRVGCDIEVMQDRILCMAHRFMSEGELVWADDTNQLKKTHLIWSIKESAFKTWGRKHINWKNHILIENLEWHHIKGEFTGTIGNHTGTMDFYGSYEYFSKFLFVWTVQSL